MKGGKMICLFFYLVSELLFFVASSVVSLTCTFGTLCIDYNL